MISENYQIIETAAVAPYYLYLRSDGIVFARVSSDGDVSLSLLKDAALKLGEMVNYSKVPLLITHDDFAHTTAENREYWAKKEACMWSLAEALVTRSTGMNLVYSFYIRVNKPERPTRMFENEEEAVKWLKTFL